MLGDDVVCRAWSRGTRVLIGAVDAALARIDLTAAEYEILNALTATCSLRMVDLARQAVLTKSGVTRAVQHLESQGLVERRCSGSDRRSFVVSLTASGHERHRQGQRLIETTLRDLLLEFTSPRDREILVRIYRDVVAEREANGCDVE